MTNEEIKTKGQTYLMNTFNRGAICMVEGQGSYLKDADGKQYLDFLAGIVINIFWLKIFSKIKKYVKLTKFTFVH